MTATNRGSQRNPLDEYPTPSWAVRRLLEGVVLPSGNWLEPTAGMGHIIHAVNQVRNDVAWAAIDIQLANGRSLNTLAQQVTIGDFLSVNPSYLNNFQVLISNPPFDLAEEVVRKCWMSSGMTVMLLRLNWLASNRRSYWLRRRMPNVYVLPDRPNFMRGSLPTYDANGKKRKKNGDSCDYGWFVWTQQQSTIGSIQILGTTSLDERRRG